MMAPADGKGEEGDEPGYTLTPENLCVLEVYGDWFHTNPGTHSDSGIGNDVAWQVWWRELTVIPSRRYDALSDKVWRIFVEMLGGDLRGVQDRQWNLEQFIVFQTVILQQA